MPDGARIQDEELRRIAATGDPVSDLHRMITAHAVRLHIPLRDVVQVRDAAKALRILASTLEVECQSREETWKVLFRCKTAIEMANRLISPKRRRG